MPRLIRFAAPLAIAAMATMLAFPAAAGGRYHHHSDGGDVAAAAAIGIIGGVLLGSALASPPPPPPVYYYEPVPPPPVYYRPAPRVVYQPVPVYDAPVYEPSLSAQHQSWCAGRYRSYEPYDNTWVDNHGRLRPCQSPYYGG